MSKIALALVSLLVMGFVASRTANAITITFDPSQATPPELKLLPAHYRIAV
jgi:hypothetical protein